jgi:hypothetical protein
MRDTALHFQTPNERGEIDFFHPASGASGTIDLYADFEMTKTGNPEKDGMLMLGCLYEVEELLNSLPKE